MGRRSKSGGALRHSTGLQRIQYMRRYLELKQTIKDEQEKAREKLRIENDEVCGKIFDLYVDPLEYDSWCDRGPDDNQAFLEYAKTKLKELQEKEVKNDTTV